jgi:MFS family permease
VEDEVNTSAQADKRALRAVAVQFFANGATIATIVPRLPELREQVGVSIGVLGLVLTVGSLASLIGVVFAGRMIARAGSRRVLIFGGVLSIGFLPVIGIATSPVLLALGLFGLLFFDVFIDVAMNVQGSAISARRHTPVMNRLHGLWSLGAVTGGLVTVVSLRADIGVAVQFTVVAIALISVLRLVASGLLPTDDEPTMEASALALAPSSVFDDDTASTDASTPSRASAGGVLSLAGFVLGVGGAAAMAIEMTNTDWAAFRLGDDLSAAPGVAGLGFVIFSGAMTVGRLSGDFVQVRVGDTALIRGASALVVIGAVLATLVASVPVSIIGFLIGGIGTAVMFPQLYDRAARSPGPPGSGFTAMLIGQRGSAVVTPALVGALANTDAFSVGQAMAVVIIPAALAIMATTFVSRSD